MYLQLIPGPQALHLRRPALSTGIVALGFLFVRCGASGAESAATVVVPAGVHDFGSVEQGDAVSHAFRLENAGSAPLRIENVKGSCGCTAAVPSEREIPPGGGAEISVRLETDRIAGPTRKTVTVYTNDPVTPTLGLTLAGVVTSDLVLSPTSLYLGRLRRGQVTGRDLQITSGRPGGKARVTWVEPASPAVRATLTDRVGGGQQLHVEIDSGLPIGPFTDRLLLHTTSSRQPEVSVSVFGTVEGDVVVVPPQLTFGLTAGRAWRGVQVRNEGATPVTVTSARVPTDVGTAELETIQPGREYRVIVRLRDGLGPGTVEGSLDIFTDHPVEGHLVVPLYGVVRPGRG